MMKIGYLQFKPEFGETTKNLSTIDNLLQHINADVFILPELCTTGYLFLESDNLNDFAETIDGETISTLKTIAAEKDSAIIAGFFEKSGSSYFNSQAFIKPDGTVHTYRKIHLFDREKLFFKPGNKPLEIVEFRGAKFGMLICFDWLFPEIYRKYALMGADIITHSTNLVLPYCQKASYARAVENRMYIAIANRIGTEERGSLKLSFTGGSIIYSPHGEILANSNETGSEVKITELDLKRARNKWITPKNHLLEDRRPEFY